MVFSYRILSLTIYLLITCEQENVYLLIHLFIQYNFLIQLSISHHAGNYEHILEEKSDVLIDLTVWRERLTLIQIHTYLYKLQLSLMFQHSETV